MTRGRLPGGGGSSVVGKRETRLYEPEERLHSFRRGVKTGAFCSASRNASAGLPISHPLANFKESEATNGRAGLQNRQYINCGDN